MVALITTEIHYRRSSILVPVAEMLLSLYDDVIKVTTYAPPKDSITCLQRVGAGTFS